MRRERPASGLDSDGRAAAKLVSGQSARVDVLTPAAMPYGLAARRSISKLARINGATPFGSSTTRGS